MNSKKESGNDFSDHRFELILIRININYFWVRYY